MPEALARFNSAASPTPWSGILFIGDPHLAARAPGFRRDDYPRATLAKLKWSLTYAKDNALIPVLLGDLFHYPRDNATWLLIELLQLFDEPVLAISGNHDCSENALSQNDSLSLLAAAGKVRLLDITAPWSGIVNGLRCVIGGSCWGEKLPAAIDRAALGEPDFVCWITHHDLQFPGYEEAGRFSCRPIPGIDLVVNGHIHRNLGEVSAGATLWCNPGNISRVNRSDATRDHVPSVLRVTPTPGGCERERIAVPHEPFDAVFHPATMSDAADTIEQTLPAFVRGLLSIEQYKTGDGAALREFLDQQLPALQPPVAAAIRELAAEVLGDGQPI